MFLSFHKVCNVLILEELTKGAPPRSDVVATLQLHAMGDFAFALLYSSLGGFVAVLICPSLLWLCTSSLPTWVGGGGSGVVVAVGGSERGWPWWWGWLGGCSLALSLQPMD